MQLLKRFWLSVTTFVLVLFGVVAADLTDGKKPSEGDSETVKETAEEDLEKRKKEYLKKSGGRHGNTETREELLEFAEYLDDNGYTDIKGDGFASEEYLAGPDGGRKGSNYTDITATAPDGKTTIRINTVDTLSNGDPTPREATNANSINTKTSNMPGNNPEIIIIPKGAGLDGLKAELGKID